MLFSKPVVNTETATELEREGLVSRGEVSQCGIRQNDHLHFLKVRLEIGRKRFEWPNL